LISYYWKVALIIHTDIKWASLYKKCCLFGGRCPQYHRVSLGCLGEPEKSLIQFHNRSVHSNVNLNTINSQLLLSNLSLSSQKILWKIWYFLTFLFLWISSIFPVHFILNPIFFGDFLGFLWIKNAWVKLFSYKTRVKIFKIHLLPLIEWFSSFEEERSIANCILIRIRWIEKLCDEWFTCKFN